MRVDEVFVSGNKPKAGDYAIGYKQWVWVINKDNFDEFHKEILTNLKVPEREHQYLDDTFTLAMWVREEYPQAVVGEIGHSTIIISAENYRPSTNSPTLMKLMKALKLDDVIINYYDEEVEEDDVFAEDRAEFLKPLKKKTFYHGTSYAAWKGIRRTGIRAMGHKTNFEDIKHDDKIFITLNREKALFHARTAGNQTNSAGIIIELKIPDVDQLVTDYDVALSNFGQDHHNSIRLGYSEMNRHIRNQYAGVVTSDAVNADLQDVRSSGRDKLSTKIGIFGYIGRIPANFIDGVWGELDSLSSSIASDEFGFEDDIVQAGLDSMMYFTPKQFDSHIGDVIDELNAEMEEDED